MKRRRSGFTLIELLTVIVIIGLLATIALVRFWGIKERSYRVSIKNDLKTAALQQERYFESNMSYAGDVTGLPDFNTSAGVTVTVTWSGTAGWAATGSHVTMPTQLCGYFVGPAPAGIAGPATTAGIITCDE